MAGDASIHLLVQYNAAAPKRRHTVLRAVLLDGGDIRFGQIGDTLSRTIDQIEKNPLYNWTMVWNISFRF
jgi:hypothetical protein